ncbi:DUF5696 domain-containing protein [Cohnella sp. GCM10027633]|uniref:DUF5696 domain-containing protein n=1 Tax=unclassified Cohnella TaxID=2636738 RepID=UPI003634D03E
MVNGGMRRRKLWLIAGAAAAAVCIALAARLLLAPSVSGKLDIAAYAPAEIATPTGESWQPGEADAQGFAVAARTESLELRLDPATGQAKVTELRSGNVWLGNPSPEELEQETVGGILKTNLRSPFVLEYYETSKVQRLVVNAMEPSVRVSFARMEQGVAANYEIGKLGIRFSMLYELTEDGGFRVSIPAGSIAENGKFRILSIDPLPFFGAAKDDGDPGYLFVPDGPGALIRFPSEREQVGKGYFQYVYGPEITNKTFGPVTVSMPVFGMKRGNGAYVAVIAAGEKASAVRAMPSGIVSKMNAVNARFFYREEYDRRLDLGGRTIRVFEDDMLKEDRVVQYMFLDGEDADYAGMARRYRDYLLDRGELGPAIKPQANVPLHLTLVGGDTIYYGSRRYEASTTFRQAEDILTQLKQAGVNDVRVAFDNWQSGGSLTRGLGFDVEKKLGGASGLKSFVSAAHELGYTVNLFADLVQADSEGLKLSPKAYGIRSAEGEVLFDDEYYFLNPNFTYNLAEDLIRGAKKVGADGITYDRMGSLLFRDRNSKYTYTRNDTAYLYGEILDRTKERLGSAGIDLGNAYALRSATDILRLPSETHGFYEVDEAVPFYPIAIHGNVTYSMTSGNVRSHYEDEFLKSIEYGAVPSFELTWESTRTLMDTKTWGLFSSRFSQWKEKVVEEYAQFNRLASVADQPITGHYRRTEGVYVTEYANGTSVVVDYNDKSFRVEEGGRP